MANLFHGLICGWIQARQAAGLSPTESVTLLLNWIKNDDYGFCNDIESDVVKVLNTEGRHLLISHSQGLVDRALPTAGEGSTRPLFECENDLRYLDDLIRFSPGTEGKWFATARQLGSRTWR